MCGEKRRYFLHNFAAANNLPFLAPRRRIKCVIFDEAHKATGNYAYAQMVKMIDQSAARYRIVGLSATPGQDVNKINEVIENLHATKLEFRSEEEVRSGEERSDAQRHYRRLFLRS